MPRFGLRSNTGIRLRSGFRTGQQRVARQIREEGLTEKSSLDKDEMCRPRRKKRRRERERGAECETEEAGGKRESDVNSIIPASPTRMSEAHSWITMPFCSLVVDV